MFQNKVLNSNICITGVSVRFNQSLQSVHESNGFTQNVLVLSSPSSVDITIHVSTNDGSARGKFL